MKKSFDTSINNALQEAMKPFYEKINSSFTKSFEDALKPSAKILEEAFAPIRKISEIMEQDLARFQSESLQRLNASINQAFQPVYESQKQLAQSFKSEKVTQWTLSSDFLKDYQSNIQKILTDSIKTPTVKFSIDMQYSFLQDISKILSESLSKPFLKSVNISTPELSLISSKLNAMAAGDRSDFIFGENQFAVSYDFLDALQIDVDSLPAPQAESPESLPEITIGKRFLFFLSQNSQWTITTILTLVSILVTVWSCLPTNNDTPNYDDRLQVIEQTLFEILDCLKDYQEQPIPVLEDSDERPSDSNESPLIFDV